MGESLRIGIVAPPLLPVPPSSYAGTERVVGCLVAELHRRGHRVTLFASGDSEVECELVPVVPRAVWSAPYDGEPWNYLQLAAAAAWRESARFEVIHSHVDTAGFLFARHCRTPVVTTLHSRLDAAGAPQVLAEFSDIPLVAISNNQRRWAPNANWVATVYHGLDLHSMPFGTQPGEYLVFVGRITEEKGIADAIELARRMEMPLRVAAKVHNDREQRHFAEVVQPAIDDGTVEFLGEQGPAVRDPLLAGARATLMLGAWPEPFGLVAIESMAAGTPVIARRVGALTETIVHGVDGFLVDDMREGALATDLAGRLDRAAIRRRALERFSVPRMTDEYEAVYRRLVEGRSAAETDGRQAGRRLEAIPSGR